VMQPDTQTISLSDNPYSETPAAKAERLLEEMNALTAFHVEHCAPYRRILNAAFDGQTNFQSLAQLPALPVRLFKELELVSQPKDQIVKTLTSSGTSGQRPSRILLDKPTASAQSRALVRILRSYLGNTRLPMMILDHPGVLKDRNAFSARGAGILGFSQLGSDHTYVLQDGTLEADWNKIGHFLDRHRGERILLFGFTFLVWRNFLRAAEESGNKLKFENSVLIHGGGWKMLADQKVSNDEFKRRLRESLGIQAIYNYYGMVEQTGSIFMECDAGYFHPADYSEILIREPRTLREQDAGKPGLIECLSTIPRSYPGHVLLTEDVGIVHGTDGCSCLRRGTFFTVMGRLASAELRGCSDTRETAS
jgi:Acyl-protein synthetase, LuxE